MNKSSELEKIVNRNNGYLISSEAINEGISKQQLYSYIKETNMEKVAHGIYVSEDTWVDHLYLIHLRNSNAVFSHETALFLHGLMEREPSQITVTVKFGYNASHLVNNGIRVITAVDNYFSIGRNKTKTNFGNTVDVYDMERTICDIIRNKKDMDPQVYQTAIQEYMKSSEKKLPVLMRYASIFRIDNIVRTYTEVML
ncbi:MAG TPA: abortive phage infection protein [Clostridia bacterium]|nr:abortive phage infection protein [Clostridia bacterium]